MHRSNHATLALLSAITIGIVNIACLSVVYLVYHDAHKPAESAVAQQGTAGAPNGSISTTAGTPQGTVGTTGQTGTQAGGSSSSSSGGTPSTSSAASTPTTTGSTSSGGSTSSSSGSTTTKSSGGGTGSSSSGSGSSSSSGGTSTTPSTPASLAKGAPCQTQTPPAGVCTAVLSFNNQKDGNPYWDPTLLANIKQGIASDSFVQLLGLNPTTIYNSMTVALKENTWSGSATHGTIQGTLSAQGQSQATTFTLDWNGSKWIVDDAAQN